MTYESCEVLKQVMLDSFWKMLMAKKIGQTHQYETLTKSPCIDGVLKPSNRAIGAASDIRGKNKLNFARDDENMLFEALAIAGRGMELYYKKPVSRGGKNCVGCPPRAVQWA